MQQFPPSQMILSPRPTLQGTGNGDSLENILTDQIANGALCYVVSRGAYYQFDAPSMDPVLAPAVIATGRGASHPGRWKQLPTAAGPTVDIQAYWDANGAQPNWYLNGITGDDTNDGITPATPLKHAAELSRRVGPIWNISTITTVHVQASITDSIDAIVRRANLTDRLDIIGTPVVFNTNQISNYNAPLHSTETFCSFSAYGVVDWAPFLGARARLTRAVDPGITWIGATGSELGIATTLTPSWSRVTAGGIATTTDPIIDDEYVLETLPVVPFIGIQISGPNDVDHVNLTNRMLTLDSVRTLHGLKINCDTYEGNMWLAYGCAFGGDIAVVPGGELYSSGTVLGCYIGDTNTVQVLVNYNLSSCLVHTVLFGGDVYLYGSGRLLTNTLVQFGRIYIPQDTTATLGSVFQSNVTTGIYGVFLSPGSSLQLSSFTQLDVTDYGLVVSANSTIELTAGTVNLAGSVEMVRIVSPSLIFPLTWSEFTSSLPNLDFSKRGTFTLVGGSQTVAVPGGYARLSQVIFPVQTLAGGTPGFVGVPDVSRTTGQFVAQSSSGTDTSTYSYVISPLGLNINVLRAT